MAKAARAVLKVENRRFIGVPDELRKHTLIAGRCFYTLPRELLEDIVERVGEDHFDQDILKVDRNLSAIMGDHSRFAGFHNLAPIPYPLLGRPLPVAAFVELSPWAREIKSGPPTEKEKNLLNVLDQRLDWFHSIAQAYAGWLAINTQFAREQDDFYKCWGESINPTVANEYSRLGKDAASDSDLNNNLLLIHARDTWLRRWHLVSTAGPFLVTPAMPQLPIVAQDAFKQIEPLGVSFFYPSIFPLLDRDRFRNLIEDAMNRCSLPEHLSGWGKIISASAAGKKQLPRLRRIFLLQHYWRIVFSRHARALKGRMDGLRRAFAIFLRPMAEIDVSGDVNPETIRKDLGDIAAARGGANWYLRRS